MNQIHPATRLPGHLSAMSYLELTLIVRPNGQTINRPSRRRLSTLIGCQMQSRRYQPRGSDVYSMKRTRGGLLL